MLRLIVVWMLAPLMMTLNAGVSAADNFPSKPIRVLTSPPGGGGDFMARLLTQGLSAGLGQQAIVDNRLGFVATETLTKSPPDGYTLLVMGTSVWLTPYLQSNVPWDPIKDFIPVTFAANSPSVLVVHPSSPVTTVKELIALAKAKPGTLNYSAGTTGGTSHLGSELLKAMANVNIVHVRYKGNAASITAVLSGEVQMTVGSAAAVASHIKSGKLRGLAITGIKPSALAPGLPPISDAGLPGYEVLSIDAVFAPAGTPGPVIQRLNQELVRVVNSADVKQKFFDSGVEPVGNTTQEAEKFIKADIVRWRKVIKDAGIRADN